MFKLFKKKNNNPDEQLVSFMKQQLVSNERLQQDIADTIRNEVCKCISNSFNYGAPVTKALNDIFNDSIKQVIQNTDFTSYVGCLEMIFDDVIKNTDFEYNRHTIEIFKNMLGNSYFKRFQLITPDELFDMYMDLVAKDLSNDYDFFNDNDISIEEENCVEVECTMHIEKIQSKYSSSHDIVITFMCSDDEECKYNAQMRFLFFDCLTKNDKAEAYLLNTSAENKPERYMHIGKLTSFDSVMIQANRNCCKLNMFDLWKFETDFSSTKTVEVHFD